MNALHQFFSVVCGQVHVWRVGGLELPLCQRCTGLYVGAACAVALWLAFRPRPTNAVLWLHGAALLLMIPFGYHLAPQGPDVRTLTGFVFGFGLVYFLLLLPAARTDDRRRDGGAIYGLGAFAAAAAVLAAVHLGGTVSAMVLSWAALAGLAALAVLAAANLLLIPIALRRTTTP